MTAAALHAERPLNTPAPATPGSPPRPSSIAEVRHRLQLTAEASLDRFNARYAARRRDGRAPDEAMRLAAADVAAEIRRAGGVYG
jgi:hypothetical protein